MVQFCDNQRSSHVAECLHERNLQNVDGLKALERKINNATESIFPTLEKVETIHFNAKTTKQSSTVHTQIYTFINTHFSPVMNS